MKLGARVVKWRRVLGMINKLGLWVIVGKGLIFVNKFKMICSTSTTNFQLASRWQCNRFIVVLDVCRIVSVLWLSNPYHFFARLKTSHDAALTIWIPGDAHNRPLLVHTSHSVNCGIGFARSFYLSNLWNASFTVSSAWDILARTDACFSCLTLPSAILWTVLQRLDDGRWTNIRKLGWGPRSSTWLATNDDFEDIGAIKIYNVASS